MRGVDMDEKSDDKGLFGTIGKVVGNLIFEKTDDSEESSSTETLQTASSAESSPVKKEVPELAARENPPPVDPKIYEKLKSVVDGKVSPFSQFSDMLDSLSEVISDESTRYAAALKAVGKSYGITLDQIVSSIDAKLGTLDEEKDKFSATMKKSEEELAGFQDKILQKDKAIESLRQQMEVLEAEKREIERSVNEKKMKIEMVRKDFVSSADMLKVEIARRKEIVLKFLQGGKQ
jgi:chromosome segregation ATPase